METQGNGRTCPRCGLVLSDDIAFCSACGSAVGESAALCPACEAANPFHSRFCGACGAPLGTPAQADRRVVTVLFADLSGFTGFTELSDPEEVHRLIALWLDRLSGCISRWGGFVDKFIGDCVMALFGAPVAYENEPERAVRAAMDMHRALDEWSERPEGEGSEDTYRPRLRIGITTGPVVMGLFAGGGARNYTAVGDTVNVAARLEGRCEPGRILVDAATYEQTKHLFEYTDEQVLEVRGRREPVRARHVIGPRAERGKARGFQGKRTHLVGRETELERLRASWGRAREGQPHVCLITGPAGIGKSRLVEELIAVESLAPESTSLGRSYPYAGSTPWEPIAELLRDLHAMPDDLPPEESAERIARGAREPWGPEQLAGLTIAFGGGDIGSPALKSYKAAERLEWISHAITAAIRAGSDSPRLLILEDLHWADHTTLEFLCRLPSLPLQGPFMVVLVSRPPLPDEHMVARLLEEVPDCIDLAPLTEGQARAFLESLLERHELPDDFIERIVERAEGNPLFIEETLKSLLESDALAFVDGSWRAVGDVADLQIPDTVESVLTTRIDGLDAATKSVLQYASIVGRRFWSGVLTDALANRTVDRELDRLLEGAFVRSLASSSLRGEREFLFEHLLLQEVAYEGILRGLRAELHGAVAAWLEKRIGGGSVESDELIGFHYERSKTPEKALPFLERAARSAWARGALSDACSLVDRATEAASDPRDRGRLLSLAEEFAGESGDVERRRRLVEELESLAESSDDPRLAAEAAYRRARYLLDTGDLPAARAEADAALEGFERLGDISMAGDAYRLLGRISHLWGDYPEALRSYRASLPLERQAGDRLGQAQIFDRLGLVQVDLGNFTTGLDYFEAARDLCVELGDRLTEARVLAHQADALRWLGQYDRAEATAREATELAKGCGSQQALAGADLILARVLAAKGATAEAASLLRDLCSRAARLGQPGLEARAWLELARVQDEEEADESAARALEIARRTALTHVEILALARRAALDLEDGEVAAADQASAAAVRLLDLHGSIEGPEEYVLHTRARALDALGRAPEATAMLKRAHTIVVNRAARVEDAEMRERFLRDVPLNREIRDAFETKGATA